MLPFGVTIMATVPQRSVIPEGLVNYPVFFLFYPVQAMYPAHCNCRDLTALTMLTGGPGSSVGIATDYGLDGPESNPSGDEIFRPSRPALGPTQPPVQ